MYIFKMLHTNCGISCVCLASVQVFFFLDVWDFCFELVDTHGLWYPVVILILHKCKSVLAFQLQLVEALCDVG